MIDAKNIKFEYADKVAPNVNKEQSMINNINQWFKQSAETIIAQTGMIVVYFQDAREERVSFDGMADELQAILYQQLKKFQPLHTRRPDK